LAQHAWTLLSMPRHQDENPTGGQPAYTH
jgi:hypothetical protein